MNRPPVNPAEGCVDAVERMIGRLYRSALRVPPDGFRAWALRQIRALVPYDAALWGTGTIIRWKFHTCVLIDLPERFPQVLEATRTVNPIVPHILANLDTPVDMAEVIDDEDFFASEIYRKGFAPFGISRILSTAHVDARSGLYSLITLYRRDPRQRFNEQDKVRQQRLAYHLSHAAAHAFFLHLVRMIGERPALYGAAVVDREGLFHEVQSRFLDLLDEHFPGYGGKLPFRPPEAGTQATIGGLCVRAEALGELTCLVAWPAGPLDRLTERERQVVYGVAHGLSFKQVARQIDLAPSTVANHLYRVYRKLGLKSRTDLARLVYPDSGDVPLRLQSNAKAS